MTLAFDYMVGNAARGTDGFADSLLEGTGFELVVPLRDWYR